jgi:hypothetical protein
VIDAADSIQERGFPGSIRTDDRHEFALAHVHTDALERSQATKADMDILNRQLGKATIPVHNSRLLKPEHETDASGTTR